MLAPRTSSVAARSRRAAAPLLALALLVACAAPVPAQRAAAPEPGGVPGGFFQVDLFTAGDMGVDTYRIPALAVTPQGTILAVCDARWDDPSDLPGNIDIVLRRSVDLGRSWSDVAIIADFPEDEGAGDPSLIVDEQTGRVFCFYAYGPPGVGFFNSQGGSSDVDDPDTLHAHVIWSDDEGATWSGPLDLNPQIKAPAWQALFAASGHGLQLRDGRLLQPYTVRNGAGAVTARNAYSDDGGVTWTMGGKAGTDVNESKLVELDDGSLMQNMRHNGTKARFTSLSTDGGASFGAEVQDPTLIDPNVNASFTRYASVVDGDDQSVILFTNPSSTAGRTGLRVRASHDEALSWPAERVVEAGPTAYSSLAVLPDGSVGLLYERGEDGPYETVTFARFDLAWIGHRPELLMPSGRPRAAHPDLWAWLDASDPDSLGGPGPDAGGDPVELWSDVSGWSEHDLRRVVGAGGVLEADAVNGLPAVSLASGDALWGAAASAHEFMTIPNAYTLFVVARLDELTGTHYLLDRTTGGGGIGLRATTADGGRWELHAARTFNGSNVNVVVPSASVALGDFAIHTVVVHGTDLEHHLDGELVATGSFTDGGLPLIQGGLILGADVSTSNGAAIAVAEVLAYDVALRPFQRQAIEAYLARKYDL